MDFDADEQRQPHLSFFFCFSLPKLDKVDQRQLGNTEVAFGEQEKDEQTNENAIGNGYAGDG